MDARAIYQAYLAYFGRPPDPTGLGAFAAASQRDVINAFSASAESQALYASSSLAEQVNAIYLNLFGRVAEPAGATYWLNELAAGRFSLAEMAFAVLNGARNEDALVVTNKLRVMESFVGRLVAQADGGAAYAGNSAAASARGFLSTVGADASSVAQALARVDTAVQTVASHLDAGKDGPAFSISPSDGRVFPLTFQTSSFTSSSTTRTAGLDAFRADSRFAGINGAGQTVVVIDSSFDLDHPAFGADANRDGVADRILYSADFTAERNGANTRATALDKHGTHVASLVAGELTNAPGMAPGANLILLQGLTEIGSGTDNDIQQALQWVIRNASIYNIVAVNMSLGGSDNDAAATRGPMSDELAALAQLGIVTLVAAGNSYEDFQTQGVSSPASDPGAFGVSASNNSNSVLAAFSQRSAALTDLVAPGQGVAGASAGGGTIALSGTSMATPIASGAVALAQQLALQTLGRRLAVDEVFGVMQRSASTFIDSEIASDRVRNSGASFRHLDIKAMGEAVLALAPASTTPSPVPMPTPVPAPAPAPANGSRPPIVVPPAPGRSPTPAPTPNPTPVPTPIASPGDDFGDAATTAGSLAAGQGRNGDLERAGDRDWFGIDLTAGMRYDIALTGVTLEDPYLRVFSADGRALAENDDRSGGGLDSALSYVAPSSGRFYLVADSYLSRGAGTYSISVAAGQAVGGGDSGTVGSGDRDVNGGIGFGGEVDSYTVALTAGTTYTFTLRGADSGGGTLEDPFLELRSGGAVLGTDDDSGVGLDAELRITATSSGNFTLRASSYSDSDTGSYSLSIRASSASPGGGNGGATDTVPGSTASGATIAAGGQVSGSIEFGGDEDWYRVALESGRDYSFRLTGLSDGLLTLYDAQGRYVASDDDGGDGLDPLLAFRPSASGTYLLAASAYSDRETGNYSLSASSSAAPVNGGARGAGDIRVGVPVNGVLASADGFDVYAGTLAPGSYRVTVRPGSGADPLSDPFIYVDSDTDFFDGLYDDDGGIGLDSDLTFSIATTTSGVIAVGGFDSGAYTLLIQTL